MLPRKRPSSCVLVVLVAGCSSPSLPGVLVGESAHFRLFIDPDLDPSSLSPSQQGQQGLDALETDWADKQTMLKMPEGRKIDYHLMTGGHIADICNLPELVGPNSPGGCERVGPLQIAAGYLPYQHELIHAYMELVSPNNLPIPLLVEGTAQSIGCSTQAGTDLRHDIPWQQVVRAVARDPGADVYAQGGLLARYLIRTQGIDAFVRYYQQAPGRRDPALFATNFSAFWNMTIDDVWTAMHVVNPGAATSDEAICPCSLPALPTDGQPIANDVVNPYWTLGDTQGTSIAMTAPGGVPIVLEDCEGVTPHIFTSNPGVLPGTAYLADANVAIAQLADGRPRYLPAPITRASVGQYLVDSCAGGTPYPLPADFLSGPGNVWILVSESTTGSGTKMFLQLQVPFAAQVTPAGWLGLCDNCVFNQGSCHGPLFGSPVGITSTVAPGPLNVELFIPGVSSGATTVEYATGSALQFTK